MTSHAFSEDQTDTALVLGGGGALGNAWLIGIVAGLDEAGVDVTAADAIVGTSAGATAAAQLVGARPAQLFRDIVAEPPAARHASAMASHRPRETTPGADPLTETSKLIAGAADAADMRRSLGAWAIARAAAAPISRQHRWRETVAARLPRRSWPNRRLLLTAVDADSGEAVVFDRNSDVELVDAVAASCSSASAYSIGDRRYIDGGYRSNADNADLATGYRRVLVLSPFSGRSRTPLDWGLHLATQVDALRASGSSVETVFPDGETRAWIDDNAMDLSRRPASARAGFDQGTTLARQVSLLWR